MHVRFYTWNRAKNYIDADMHPFSRASSWMGETSLKMSLPRPSHCRPSICPSMPPACCALRHSDTLCHAAFFPDKNYHTKQKQQIYKGFLEESEQTCHKLDQFLGCIKKKMNVFLLIHYAVQLSMFR